MNLGTIFDDLRRMASEGHPEEAIKRAAEIKDQADLLYWVSKNPSTRKRMSELIRQSRATVRDIRVAMAPGLSQLYGFLGKTVDRKITLTTGDLRAFRDQVLRNIQTHCDQLYGRGTMNREACRIASAIAAAEISDVLEEKFGITF